VAQPHCSRWGPSPQFLAHVCYGQTAGWIKIPLGRDEDLGPDDIVLDGDPALPPKGRSPPPNFQPMSVVAKWLDGSRWDATWYGGRPQPRRHCIRWGSSSH